MFASKTPRDLNHDPEAWLGKFGDASRSSRQGGGFEGEAFEYAPRPEFDHVQHNEPNPILVAAREEGVHYIGTMKVLPAHIDHARRVLERLTRLAALS